MPIQADDRERYSSFAVQLTKEMGAMLVPPDTLLWHYTTGTALIGILESATIYSTQISCLNDTSELRYGSNLYREAIRSLIPSRSDDPVARDFLDSAIEYFKEDEDAPLQMGAPHFVTSFSEESDDLSQWRAYGGGENGYAVAFKAVDLWGVPNSMLARVVYDPSLHHSAAQRAVEAMVSFFKEAVEKHKPAHLNNFAIEFFEAWDPHVTAIAPIIKDPAFYKERECRIIKGFGPSDLNNLKFVQKNSLMSRHLPLQPGRLPMNVDYRLPIAQVMVGPCRNPKVSRVSVDTLLRQRGYPSGLVTISKIPFQVT